MTTRVLVTAWVIEFSCTRGCAVQVPHVVQVVMGAWVIGSSRVLGAAQVPQVVQVLVVDWVTGSALLPARG